MSNTGAVCAVIVTYNRKELLRECLHAVLAQTAPVASIVVVDNKSSDGTAQMLQEEFSAAQFPNVTVLSLPANVGGAGGFHEGMRHAVVHRCEWLWLMDDDTIATPDALAKLLETAGRFPLERAPVLLASKAIWTDGTLHPMNVPEIRSGDAETAYLAAAFGAVSVRTATFVSVLIRRDAVQQKGLPVADYFIWGDDTEYTARVLRDGMGVLVPESLVLHKTATRYGPVEGSPARFYYFVRNGLWMLLRSDAWTRGEKTKNGLTFLRIVATFLRRTPERPAAIQSIARGFFHGLTRRPLR
jgi:GT2 family glycosyltransferase